MPNLNFNAGFEPEEAAGGRDNLSALGFHNNEDEEDLEAENNDIEAGDKEIFDLKDEEAEENDDTGSDIRQPIFDPAASALADDDDEESEDDDDEFSFAPPSGISPCAKVLEDEIEDEDNLEEELEVEDEEDEDEAGEDSAIISKAKIILAKQLLQNIQENSQRLISLFGGLLDDGDEERIGLSASGAFGDDEEEGGRVIEGIFNGENMIGPDGKEYAVPPNYASKSKLVEGDMLKLTITDRGTFVYKQTKPVERKRIIGKLEKDSNGNYLAIAEKKKFRVITASITYYKGIPGDKVVILVPIAGDSAWAAVENVIKSK